MRPDRNFIKDAGRCAFWYPLRWIVQTVPGAALPALASLLGGLDRLISGRRRRDRMRAHIASGLGGTDAEACRVLTANLRHHALNMLEFLRYPRMSPEQCQAITDWEGREHLDRALQSGSGVMLCTAHFGAKQMLQMALGHAGYRVNQLNYHLEAGALTWVQQHVAQRQRIRIETRIPCRFIPARGFLRDAFRCLRAGEILIVAADGAGRREIVDDSFVPLPFLGKRMWFPTNYVSLARRTGAVLMPCFAIRAQGRHRIVMDAPLEDTGTGGAAGRFAAILETQVRRHPAQWEFWEEFAEGELLEAPGETVDGNASRSIPYWRV